MRGFVVSLATILIAGVSPAVTTAVAEPEPYALPELQQPTPVAVKKLRAGGKKGPDAAKQHAWKSPKVTWPKPGSAVVSPEDAKPERVGTLPVDVAAAPAKGRTAADLPDKIKVTVADRKTARAAGIDGVLLAAHRADSSPGSGAASVEVDYGAFRGAYGGDWAARLHLVELPACALTTPHKPDCRTQKPLQTSNDTEAGTLSAPVTFKATTTAAPTPTVLAATAEAAGSSGSFKATSLEPAGSWSAGGATGSFNWSYPIGVPAVPGGLQPSITLDYNSQAVDGRTAASNNQPSWIGDGWNWEPGYIERRYKSCNDDKDKTGATNTTKVGDQCWYNDNATLSLGGKSTELVYEDGKGWHPVSDSGEKIEKLTGAANGDKGTAGVDGVGEHWKLTTTDGTQYFFGSAKVDGTTYDSTWTVPVFGNHAGEPCYKASFAEASCQQAWRWQLDYVVDPRGNAMAYYWKSEANNYGLNVSETTGESTVTSYERGGYLEHIDYGLRDGGAAKAMGQVHFGVDERCLTSCGTFDEANAKNWPDVPYDLYCKTDASECKDQYAPSFWTRKRLTAITTKVLTGGGYKDVDTWALEQGYPASGDGLSTPMWLESITRTGKNKDGGSVSLPPVTFEGEQKANRVDKLGDGLPPFVRLRLYQITTETGGTIAVNYSQPDCTASTLPAKDSSNTTRCYHFKWAFEGETAKDDWFNSYVVTQVAEGDNLATTPDKVSSYSYLDGAGWTKSTDEFSKANDRTYSVSRGYNRVQVRTGSGSDARTLTETRYFRGIDGQEVKDSAGSVVTDREEFAGMVREEATYNGDDTAKLVSAASYTPWRSEPSATRTRSGLPVLEARMTGNQKKRTRTTTSSGTRSTESSTSFDEYGMTKTVSETGDTAKSGDEQCTRITYARNVDKRLLNLVSRTETYAQACADPVALPADVIDDVRAYYDKGAFGATPSKGLITKTDRINGKGDGYDVTTSIPSICGVNKDALCYDIYGRALAAGDAYGEVTTTAYTPTTGEVPTQTVVTNSLSHATATVLDPLRGQPTQVTDPNSRVTATSYDPLGRATKIWLPTRSATTYPDSPNYEFSYLVRNNGPIITTTKRLQHDSKYLTGYAFADGLLRPFQVQELSPDRSGRLIAETFYDSRGLAWSSSGVYYASGVPEAVAVTGVQTQYPASSDTEFDGAGRATAVIARHLGDETKRTSTVYTGDTTTVIPPKGGVATTTVVDALGRTTELKQYTNAERTESQATKYVHNHRGLLEEVTDPSGAKWTYSYDVRGRPAKVEDPDKGVSTTVFDKGDRATDSTSVARGITLHSDYDALGRRTFLKKGTTTLASWTYDDATKGKGQPAKATRYVEGKAYETAVTSYNALYQPVGTKVTVPDSEGKLAGTYQWTTSYNDKTGQVMYEHHPAIGGLPEEQVNNTYTAVTGLLDTVGTDTGGIADAALVSASQYDHYGRSIRQEYGEFGKILARSNVYDPHTGQLTHSYLDRQVAPQRVEDTGYSYDLAGNVTSIATGYGQDAARTTDTQCFKLDALTRITDAWTNTSEQCATSPSDSVIGGPDAYWTTYSYDAVGNRKTETQHKTASGPTADTVRTYAAPETGKHNLPKVTQTGTGPSEEIYTYDDAGNAETRKIGSDDTEVFDWDDEGHLKSVTQVTDTTNYLYDTEGQRLIRRDSTGTTLYLPGGNELHLDKNGTVTGTRYYSVGASPIAVRTDGKLTFLFSDHHGTGTTQVTSDAAQSVTRRKSTIFGAPRGTQPTDWAGDKGFVGGTKDADTGLTHLGAREYDPRIGRFISVDPLMDLVDPQQMHGYTYGNNNPTTLSDPTGLRPDGACGGSNSNQCNGDNETFTQDNNGNWDYHSETKDYEPTANDVASDASKENAALAFISDTVHSYFDKQSEAARWMEQFWKNYQPKDYQGDQSRAMSAIAEAVNTCFDMGCPDELTYFFWDAQMAGVASEYGIFDGVGGSAGAARGAGTAARKPINLGEYPGSTGRLWNRLFGCKKCFLAGTDVLMADGSTKNIEDVEIGDEVLATDPYSGESGPRKVTRLIRTEDDKQFNTLSIATEDGVEQLTATHEHPFWSPSEKAWIAAGDLTPDMTLLTDDGSTVIVTGNNPFARYARTYNLTVDDIHTYYVLAGDTPVLVHNSGCGVEKWTSKGNLDDHFARHGEEMGFDSQAEYGYAAEDLMCVCDGRRPGVMIKRDGNTRYFLDPGTGEFGIAGERGIVTYYRPENPMGHFNNQPGALIP